jgi:hypothetical protein
VKTIPEFEKMGKIHETDVGITCLLSPIVTINWSLEVDEATKINAC